MSVMLISVAVSVYLEQTYAWASRISGAVIALIFALVLVNTNIISPHAELYDDIVWGYVVPIAMTIPFRYASRHKIGTKEYAPDAAKQSLLK